MYARIDSARDWGLYNDAELVRLLKRGHDEALEELLRRHRDALFRFCCHLMTTREDAEDICQETLARAITRVDALQSGSAFRSWLFSIARNLSVDSYRTKKRTCPMPDDEAIPLPLYTETPQDRIEIHEEHQTVAEALGKLADSHQRVLVLREVNGLSYAAIAEEMQVTQSAVETLLFRARRRLREEYSKSAVPMIALLNDLRELAMKFAAPVASGSAVTKLVVASALVGGGLATTAHVTPSVRQALRTMPQAHITARHVVGPSGAASSAPATQHPIAARAASPSGGPGAIERTISRGSSAGTIVRSRHPGALPPLPDRPTSKSHPSGSRSHGAKSAAPSMPVRQPVVASAPLPPSSATTAADPAGSTASTPLPSSTSTALGITTVLGAGANGVPYNNPPAVKSSHAAAAASPTTIATPSVATKSQSTSTGSSSTIAP